MLNSHDLHNLHRYDVIEVKVGSSGNATRNGTVEGGKRPYVIVGNEIGTKYSPTITVMPVTTSIKRVDQATHGKLWPDMENGLLTYSMILGEQPVTINKSDVIRKFGRITSPAQRKIINRVCYNAFFFGEDINLDEILA